LTGAGVDRVVLEVAADNAPARTFYTDAGYEVVGRRPGYYTAPSGARMDALVMARAMSGHGAGG
jgi:ribosomal-protein-alanine N-acetyltransferase